MKSTCSYSWNVKNTNTIGPCRNSRDFAKLQRSVEQEESRWKIKAEESQRTAKQLRREREHLEMEQEKAEME
jgi:transposase-like protein